MDGTKSRPDRWLEESISTVTRAANLGDYRLPEGVTLIPDSPSKWVTPVMMVVQVAAMYGASKIREIREERIKEQADFEQRMREKYGTQQAQYEVVS